MATRFFFPSTQAAPITNVSPDAGWEFTTGFLRRRLADKKGYSPIVTGSTIGAWTAGNDAIDRQYVSEPMAAGIVFTSGTTAVSCQLMAREFAAADNTTSRMGIRIVSNDGATVRATLLAVAQYGPATELVNTTAMRNKTYADGDTITATYTTVAGDRLCVEIGYSDAAGSTPQGAAKWGENSTDLPVNETQTTDGNGWIEFSNTITMDTPSNVKYKQGIFAITSGTGNQSVVGVGFQGTAAIFWWNDSTVLNTNVIGENAGYGLVADSTHRAAIAWASDDAAATSNSGTYSANNRCILLLSNGTPTLDADIDFVSFDSDGFTINKVSNTSSDGILIHYIILGGDVQAYVGQFTGPTAGSTGNRAYTGVGFQGNLLITLNTFQTAVGSKTSENASIGGAVSSTARFAGTKVSQDGQTTAAQNLDREVQYDTRAMLSWNNPALGTAPTIDQAADFVSFDSDGFTLNHITVTTGSVLFWAMVLKSTNGGAYDIGFISVPAAVGDVSVTGLAGRPNGAFFFSCSGSTMGTFSTGAEFETGAGANESDFGIEQDATWHGSNDNVTPTNTNQQSYQDFCFMDRSLSSQAVQNSATYKSTNSDGFTVNFGAVANVGLDVFYISFRNAVAGAAGPGAPEFMAAIRPGIEMSVRFADTADERMDWFDKFAAPVITPYLYDSWWEFLAFNIVDTATGTEIISININPAEMFAAIEPGYRLSIQVTKAAIDSRDGLQNPWPHTRYVYDSEAMFLPVSVNIVDSSVGTELLDIQVSLSLSDSGSGSESLTIQAQLSITDSSTGSEVLSIVVDLRELAGAFQSQLDGQSFIMNIAARRQRESRTFETWAHPRHVFDSNAVFLPVSVFISDLSSGSETLDIQASIPITDSSSGSESLIIQAQLSIVDSGVGTEILVLTMDIREVMGAIQAQINTQTLIMEIAAKRQRETRLFESWAHARHTIESWQVFLPISVLITDTSLGSETLAISVSLIIIETSLGSDSLQITVQVPLSEAGTANDVILTQNLLGVSDSALGSESILASQTVGLLYPVAWKFHVGGSPFK